MGALAGLIVRGISSMLIRFVGPLFAGIRLFVGGTLVYWVGRLLLGLGLYFAVTGPLAEYGLEYLESKFTGIPADLAGWLGFFNVDRALGAIASAYLIVAVSRVVLARRAAPSN